MVRHLVARGRLGMDIYFQASANEALASVVGERQKSIHWHKPPSVPFAQRTARYFSIFFISFLTRGGWQARGRQRR